MRIYLPVLTVDFHDGNGPVERIGFTLKYEFANKHEASEHFSNRWAQFMESYHFQNADLLSMRAVAFDSVP